MTLQPTMKEILGHWIVGLFDWLGRCLDATRLLTACPATSLLRHGSMGRPLLWVSRGPHGLLRARGVSLPQGTPESCLQVRGIHCRSLFSGPQCSLCILAQRPANLLAWTLTLTLRTQETRTYTRLSHGPIICQINKRNIGSWEDLGELSWAQVNRCNSFFFSLFC